MSVSLTIDEGTFPYVAISLPLDPMSVSLTIDEGTFPYVTIESHNPIPVSLSIDKGTFGDIPIAFDRQRTAFQHPALTRPRTAY